MIETYRSMPRPVRVLLANLLINNVAFYMLIPFIAGHMANDLGMAAWMVGLVLGMRTLTQQGMYLLGGTLSDRLGPKPIIVIGCALRSAGFLALGVLDTLPGLVVASALSGVAAALAAPAARVYISRASEDKRVEAFALLSVSNDAGTLLGPIIGALLLGFGFLWLSVVASAAFAVLALMQLRLLPPMLADATTTQQPLVHDWITALGNRPFLLFAAGMMGFFAIYNQIYVAVPIEARRVTGDDRGVAVLLTASAICTILFQVRVTGLARRWLLPSRSITLGLALMGLAFVPLLLWHTLPPALTDPLPGIVPSLLTILLMTAGVMLTQPFAMDMIPRLARERLVGTHIGVYYLAQGLGGTIGGLAAGAALDTGLAWLPWLLLLGIGLLSSLAIATLARLGMLEPSPA